MNRKQDGPENFLGQIVGQPDVIQPGSSLPLDLFYRYKNKNKQHLAQHRYETSSIKN